MRKLLPLVNIGLVFASVVIAISLSSTGYAKANSDMAVRLMPRQACRVQLVTLHGKQKPTVTCMDKVGPNTSNVDCNRVAVLKLYVDAYQQGSVICFTGNGFVNLTDYYYIGFLGIQYSWNDAASSYNAGDWAGKFYSDINGGGIVQRFTPYQRGEFDGNPMPNDSLSSLCLDELTPDACPGAHG